MLWVVQLPPGTIERPVTKSVSCKCSQKLILLQLIGFNQILSHRPTRYDNFVSNVVDNEVTFSSLLVSLEVKL